MAADAGIGELGEEAGPDGVEGDHRGGRVLDHLDVVHEGHGAS